MVFDGLGVFDNTACLAVSFCFPGMGPETGAYVLQRPDCYKIDKCRGNSVVFFWFKDLMNEKKRKIRDGIYHGQILEMGRECSLAYCL